MEYLERFRSFDYLWKEDKVTKYSEFLQTQPKLDDFEAELRRYNDVEKSIDCIEVGNFIRLQIILVSVPFGSFFCLVIHLWLNQTSKCCIHCLALLRHKQCFSNLLFSLKQVRSLFFFFLPPPLLDPYIPHRNQCVLDLSHWSLAVSKNI